MGGVQGESSVGVGGGGGTVGEDVSLGVGVAAGSVVAVGGDTVASTVIGKVVAVSCDVTTTGVAEGADVGVVFLPQPTTPKLNIVTVRNARTNLT